MDHDRKRTRLAGSGFEEPAASTQQRQLPIELLSEVGKHLVSDDPIATARDLSNFRQASQITNNAVEQSRLGLFEKRLARLGEASRTLHQTAIPASGLEASENFPQPDPEDRFAEPDMRVDAVGPVLKFQSTPRQQALLDQLSSLDEDSEGAALARLADHFDDLQPQQQQRLIERCLPYFAEPEAQHYLSGDGASFVLAAAQDVMTTEQKARVLDTLHANPPLQQRYFSAAERIRQRRETRPELSNSAPIEKTLMGIEADTKVLAGPKPLSPRAQMEQIEAVGRSIRVTYDEARAALMGSERSRDRSDFSR